MHGGKLSELLGLVCLCFNIQVQQHSVLVLDHEILSTVILSLGLVQEWKCQFLAEECAQILVNCLSLSGKVWLGKLTTLDMTLMG